MLYNNDQDRAVSFLLQNVEQVANWGDILQNVVLDLIRKVRLFEKTRGENPTPVASDSHASDRFCPISHAPRARTPSDKPRALTVCPYDRV